MGQTQPLFVCFVLFKMQRKYSAIFTINDERVDGVLVTRTQGDRMEGADKSTEPWWHPIFHCDFIGRNFSFTSNCSILVTNI